MGSLTLPDSGTVYLDSSGLIYSVERIQPYRALLEPMWRQANAGQFTIVSSELAVLETLVKPIRESDAVVERLFDELFNSKERDTHPGDAPIVGRSRASPSDYRLEDSGRSPCGNSVAHRL